MGGRVLWWDFEDSPDTLARRASSLGALSYVQDKEHFRWAGPSLQDKTPETALARLELELWLKSTDTPLVVIDAAESAGCPADGSDVAPWYRDMVDPWKARGAGIIVLDHVPKRREDRPKGGIGSQHKLARIDGVALYVSGVPWNKEVGGGIKLVVHKDRPGDLPVAMGKQVALVTGEHKEGILQYRIDPPTPDDEDAANDIEADILDGLDNAGSDGVKGREGIRALGKGSWKVVDAAINALLKDGRIEKEQFGKAFWYRIPQGDKQPLMDDESAF